MDMFMRRPRFKTKCFFTFLAFTLLVQPLYAEEGEITAITILADRALTLPLTQLASDYTRTRHRSVTVSFAPSFEQTLAIESGEPADIFISAHPKTLKDMQQRGFFDVYSITPLVSSRLALVTSSDYPDTISEVTVEALRIMKKPDNFLLAVANPAAAAEGFYTDQVLAQLKKSLFLSDLTVQMQNTSDILDFLKSTHAFGVVLESDALQANHVRLLATFPEKWHDKVVFTGAVIAGGAMQEARKFMAYLQEPESQRVFIKSGLYPATKNEQLIPQF